MSDDPTERDRAMYEATQNPLYLWSALASASLDGSAPLPPWIMEYLRKSALALCRLPTKSTPKAGARLNHPKAGAMCGALGLIQGKKNAFAEMFKDNHAAWTALEVGLLGGKVEGHKDRAVNVLAMIRGARFDRQVQTEMQNIRRAMARSKSARRSID